MKVFERSLKEQLTARQFNDLVGKTFQERAKQLYGAKGKGAVICITSVDDPKYPGAVLMLVATPYDYTGYWVTPLVGLLDRVLSIYGYYRMDIDPSEWPLEEGEERLGSKSDACSKRKRIEFL